MKGKIRLFTRPSILTVKIFVLSSKHADGPPHLSYKIVDIICNSRYYLRPRAKKMLTEEVFL